MFFPMRIRASGKRIGVARNPKKTSVTKMGVRLSKADIMPVGKRATKIASIEMGMMVKKSSSMASLKTSR